MRSLLIILAAVLPATALANPICASMAQMQAVSPTIATMTLPPPHGAADKCSASGGFAYCVWSFDYRAQEASDAFDLLGQVVSDCLDGAVEVIEDPGVNHPDSYTLRIFQSPQSEVSVSLKDKANLLQSFVFLRARITR